MLALGFFGEGVIKKLRPAAVCNQRTRRNKYVKAVHAWMILASVEPVNIVTCGNAGTSTANLRNVKAV
jgi:hypothetical protein